LFFSRDGSVEALAKAVAEGSRAAGAEVLRRRVPDIVSPKVMVLVPGWEDRSKRMLSEDGAPTHADAKWAAHYGDAHATATLTRGLENDVPIDGLKAVAASGWFAARPSRTEDTYKIYAGIQSKTHLNSIVGAAQEIVNGALESAA